MRFGELSTLGYTVGIKEHAKANATATRRKACPAGMQRPCVPNMIVVAPTAEWREFIAAGMTIKKKEAAWIKLRRIPKWGKILRRVRVMEERLELGKSEG